MHTAGRIEPAGDVRQDRHPEGSLLGREVRGGTISHQHGVGTDHAPYLAAEKGALGMAVLADVARRFDPAGRMHPGVLLGDAS